MQMLHFSNNTWLGCDITWASFLQESDDKPPKNAKVLFSSSGELEDADPPLQQQIIEALHMPDSLRSRPYVDLNGFCGKHIEVDKDGKLLEYSHWSRFIIKQTGRSLQAKPSFVRHDAATLPKTSQVVVEGRIPLHGPQTLGYGWEWYEMMFVANWRADSGLKIVCFNVPGHVQAEIKFGLMSAKQFAAGNQESVFQDPLLVMTIIIGQILPAYDRSVWAIRDHVCAWESNRQTETDYALFHEISRHAIHVSETLQVAERSCKALLRQRSDLSVLFGENLPPRWTATSDQLQLTTQVIENLLSRSEANRARIQNEITLAFHLASQRDNETQRRMAENAQEETVIMSNLSVVALVFLPATFICGIFGTAFFEFDTEGNHLRFAVSNQFWIFWVTVVPVSAATVVCWRYIDANQRRKIRSSFLKK